MVHIAHPSCMCVSCAWCECVSRSGKISILNQVSKEIMELCQAMYNDFYDLYFMFSYICIKVRDFLKTFSPNCWLNQKHRNLEIPAHQIWVGTPPKKAQVCSCLWLLWRRVRRQLIGRICHTRHLKASEPHWLIKFTLKSRGAISFFNTLFTIA